MAIRYKTWSDGDRLFAADLNIASNNGVVQIDTVAELTTVFDTYTDVNIVYCMEDNMTYGRTAVDFQPLIVQKETIELSNDGEGAATTSVERFDYEGSTYDTYTFKGADTFTVKDPGATVDLCVVSGGAAGGTQHASHAAGGGGGGGTRYVTDVFLTPGSYSVAIGAAGGTGFHRTGTSGEAGRSNLRNETTATNVYNPRGGGPGGHTYSTSGQGEKWPGRAGGNGGGASDGGGAGAGTAGEGQSGQGTTGGGSGPTYGQGGAGAGVTLTGWKASGNIYVAHANTRNRVTGAANTGAGGSCGISGNNHGGHEGGRAGGTGIVLMRKKVK